MTGAAVGSDLPRPRKLNLGYNLSSASDFAPSPPFSYVGQVAPPLGSAPLRPINLRIHSCPFAVRFFVLFGPFLDLRSLGAVGRGY